ncbi:hypothetical protein PR08_gp23 [Idiomarinaceae phage Phi1M2-2]|nr:hypothetical protein PR08_gp23 [Idiomarinaceae phage Phi1M2-2]AIM40780.1 hypothetical protein M22_023 [Idiomarinaceae phage Phi1M2-2]
MKDKIQSALAVSLGFSIGAFALLIAWLLWGWFIRFHAGC